MTIKTMLIIGLSLTTINLLTIGYDLLSKNKKFLNCKDTVAGFRSTTEFQLEYADNANRLYLDYFTDAKMYECLYPNAPTKGF